MEEIEYIKEEIKKIKERNTKVEAEKSWEISVERKIIIFILTYVIISLVMWILWFEKPFLNALIPSFWYLLSTISLSFLKKKYIEKFLRKRGKNKTK